MRPGLPDPALVVGDWTGETASRQEREAAAYRELRTRLRALACDFLRTRQMWSESPADGAIARAVAYQHVAGRLTLALDEIEAAHDLAVNRSFRPERGAE